MSRSERRAQRLEHAGQRLTSALAARAGLARSRCAAQRQRLELFHERMTRAVAAALRRRAAEVRAAGQLLASLGYRNVLARGFALVRDGEGRPLRSAGAVAAGARLDLEFADGHVGATADARPATAPKRAKAAQASRQRRSGAQPGDLVLTGKSAIYVAPVAIRRRRTRPWPILAAFFHRCAARKSPPPHFPVEKSDAEWRATLTPEQYHVLREHGTERAGSCALNTEKRRGTFHCAGCDQALFVNETKFDSGTGWPSFFDPLAGAIETSEDDSYFMRRTEVHCSRCGGHLGHVFDDGPPPTGLRYCINGVAMNFVPAA